MGNEVKVIKPEDLKTSNFNGTEIKNQQRKNLSSGLPIQYYRRL